MIDIVVLFFVLGVLARLLRSDLRLPEALYETLSIYLLLAIGLKGGIELSKQPVLDLAPQVLATMTLGFAIPFVLFPVLRLLKLNGADSASVAAHYGSVSVVTFAVGTAGGDGSAGPGRWHFVGALGHAAGSPRETTNRLAVSLANLGSRCAVRQKHGALAWRYCHWSHRRG
jgi:hypothetical protein